MYHYNSPGSSSLLWLLPVLTMFVTFSSLPSKLLRSADCEDNSPLYSQTFRTVFTSAIYVPVTVIILTYLYFYYILSRRTRSATGYGRTSSISRFPSETFFPFSFLLRKCGIFHYLLCQRENSNVIMVFVVSPRSLLEFKSRI